MKEISATVAIQNESGQLQLNKTIQTPNEPGQLQLSKTIQTPNEPYITGQGIVLDFGRMTSTLAKYLSSPDQETQATALRWINCFIGLARNVMLPFTPLLLSAILPTLSHPVNTIRSLAIDANTNLFTLVLDWSMQGNNMGFGC